MLSLGDICGLSQPIGITPSQKVSGLLKLACIAIGVNSNKAKVIWVSMAKPSPQALRDYLQPGDEAMVSPMVTVLQLATTPCSSGGLHGMVCAQ